MQGTAESTAELVESIVVELGCDFIVHCMAGDVKLAPGYSRYTQRAEAHAAALCSTSCTGRHALFGCKSLARLVTEFGRT